MALFRGLQQIKCKKGSLLCIPGVACTLYFIFCVGILSGYLSNNTFSLPQDQKNLDHVTGPNFLENWTNLIYPLKSLPAAVEPTGSDARFNLTKQCKIFERPKEYTVKEKQEFQPVVPRESYVFSAFYDNRQVPHMVVAIGIARVKSYSHPQYCRMWYKGYPEPEIQAVSITAVGETHDRE